MLFLVPLVSPVLSSASLSPRPQFCTSHAPVSFDFNLAISLSLSIFLSPQFAPTPGQSLSSLIVLTVASSPLLHFIFLSFNLSQALLPSHLSSFRFRLPSFPDFSFTSPPRLFLFLTISLPLSSVRPSLSLIQSLTLSLPLSFFCLSLSLSLSLSIPYLAISFPFAYSSLMIQFLFFPRSITLSRVFFSHFYLDFSPSSLHSSAALISSISLFSTLLGQ